MRAEKSPNETERLETLYNLDILDTEADIAYDAITKLAANIMETPVALISLVDGERQWFKSAFGTEQVETPIEYSFCAHAILDPFNPTIVNDATKDERFKDNPFVKNDMNVRFYFGTPLITSNNQAIGTICTIDSKVRKDPTPNQIQSLQELSKLVIIQLELRKSILEITSKIEKIEKYDETASERYEELNQKCDDILNKIRARRAARKSK